MIQDEQFIEGMIESSKVLLKSIDLMKQYYDSKKSEYNVVLQRQIPIADNWSTPKEESVLEKGKEVLNSQNEGVFNEEAISKKLQSLTDEFIAEKQNYKPKFKEGDIAKIKQVNSNMDGVKGVIKGVTKNIVIFRMDGYEHDIFIQDDYIELVKEAMFVTEDGVIIYKGNYYWILFKNFSCLLNEGIHALYDEIKTFSDKEKLNEYILMNKPVLSLNDLLSVWSYGNERKDAGCSIMFENFKKLAESKINNK